MIPVVPIAPSSLASWNDPAPPIHREERIREPS
jgi:hypothetical protein